jgi:di/tricarboxylate transporter
MTEHMLIVFGILAGAVVLFASGRVRPDVVAILVVLALNLTGVLTIQESLAGFGQPVVVLIAAVSVVSEGLIATGVAHRLGEAVMKAGRQQRGAAGGACHAAGRNRRRVHELLCDRRHVHPRSIGDRHPN